ncbi:MAG: NUDIX domain-containing protein [Faecousia sp.]
MPIVTFYRDDPNAPRTTQGAHLGANAIITWDGMLLLEKRRDCDVWGLVGGGVKNWETPAQAMAREIREEIGLRVPAAALEKCKVYGEPGRIAAYCDGSVWRMVIVAFRLELEKRPELKISPESRELRFFTREEVRNLNIVITHSDIVEELYLHSPE